MQNNLKIKESKKNAEKKKHGSQKKGDTSMG